MMNRMFSAILKSWKKNVSLEFISEFHAPTKNQFRMGNKVPSSYNTADIIHRSDSIQGTDYIVTPI